MTATRRVLVVVFLVSLCFTFSCATDQRIKRKGEDLQEELMKEAVDFNRMIAWRYFDEASQKVIPERQADFLVAAETIYARVHMEGYKVTYTMVSPNPFPRQRGEVVMPPPEKEKPDTPSSLSKQVDKDKKKSDAEKRKKIPKAWYGLVLVRYLNLNVAPSANVRSPLIRQHWYYYPEPGVWLVDPEIEQLIDLGRRPAEKAKSADKSSAPPPIVPTP